MDLPLSQDTAVRLHRLSRLACILKWVTTACIAIMVVAAAGLALALVFPDFDYLAPETSVYLEDYERAYADIPLLQRIGLLGLALGFFGFLIALAWNMRALFRQFEALRFFEQETLNHIFLIGSCLIAFAVFDFVEDPIASVVSTLDLPPDQRIFEVSTDGAELFVLIFGGLILVFGWIMREAALIDEENRHFV